MKPNPHPRPPKLSIPLLSPRYLPSGHRIRSAEAIFMVRRRYRKDTSKCQSILSTRQILSTGFAVRSPTYHIFLNPAASPLIATVALPVFTPNARTATAYVFFRVVDLVWTRTLAALPEGLFFLRTFLLFWWGRLAVLVRISVNLCSFGGWGFHGEQRKRYWMGFKRLSIGREGG